MAAAAFPAAFAKGKPSQQTDWTCRFNSFKCSSGDYFLFLFFTENTQKQVKCQTQGGKSANVLVPLLVFSASPLTSGFLCPSSPSRRRSASRSGLSRPSHQATYWEGKGGVSFCASSKRGCVQERPSKFLSGPSSPQRKDGRFESKPQLYKFSSLVVKQILLVVFYQLSYHLC